MAVTGLTKHGYSRQPGDTRWTNHGGILRGAPAVAQVEDITHIIGVNSRGYLVHRTNATGYHPITSSGRCSDPAAASSGATVTIACIGDNRRGYTLSFDGRQHTPTVRRLADIGGGLTSIAVMQTGQGPVFAATGGQYTTSEDGFEWPANTYLKDPSHSNSWERLQLPCDGPLATTMSSSHWFSACQTEDAISVFVADDDEEPSFFTVPGVAAGKIGIAAVGDGDEAVLAVQGLDGYIRHRGIDMEGSIDSRWTQLSGACAGGVATASTADLT